MAVRRLHKGRWPAPKDFAVPSFAIFLRDESLRRQPSEIAVLGLLLMGAVSLLPQSWPSCLWASLLLAAALPALLLPALGLRSADHCRAIAKGVLFVPIVLSAPRLAGHLFSNAQALPLFAISCLKASGSWGLLVAGAGGVQLAPAAHAAAQVLAGFWAASHNSGVCAAVLSTQLHARQLHQLHRILLPFEAALEPLLLVLGVPHGSPSRQCISVMSALQAWLGVAAPAFIVLRGQAKRYRRFKQRQLAAALAAGQPSNLLEQKEWQYNCLARLAKQLSSMGRLDWGLLALLGAELAAMHSLLQREPQPAQLGAGTAGAATIVGSLAAGTGSSCGLAPAAAPL